MPHPISRVCYKSCDKHVILLCFSDVKRLLPLPILLLFLLHDQRRETEGVQVPGTWAEFRVLLQHVHHQPLELLTVTRPNGSKGTLGGQGEGPGGGGGGGGGGQVCACVYKDKGYKLVLA